MADELKTTWTAEADSENHPPPGFLEDESRDRLSESGIFRHGYGLIPKYAMQDRELSLIAKSIYAYLCSLCGGGETAFPSVETIRSTLNLGKESYYQHRKRLEEAGYITVQQRHQGKAYSSNLYTLNENPRRFHLETAGEWEDRIYPIVRFSGIRGAGYGILPRTVMTDQRLDAKAKAVYAYFASLTGSGVSAFPSREHLLRDLSISHPTYYKCLNQLKKTGYLMTKQRKTGLHFAVNDYYLLDNADTETDNPPQKIKCPADDGDQTKNQTVNYDDNTELMFDKNCYVNPCAKNPDTMKATVSRDFNSYVNPCAKNPDTMGHLARYYGNPCANFPDAINPDTTNNMIYTNSLPIHLSINREETQKNLLEQMDGWMDREKREDEREGNKGTEQAESNAKRQSNENKAPRTEETDQNAEPVSEEAVREMLRQSTGYRDIPIMYPKMDMALIDNLIDLMTSALCGSHKDVVRVGQKTYRREDMKRRFQSLNVEHLRYVLQCVQEREGRIRNLRAYYLAALLNAPDTMELYYKRLVEQDMMNE